MLLRIILAGSLITFVNLCSAQVTSSLSKAQLLKEIKRELPDSMRQRYYNQLGEAYVAEAFRKNDVIDSAFFFLRKSVYLVDSSNVADNEITRQGLSLLGMAYIRNKDFRSGIKVFDQVINSYKRTGNKEKEADTRMSEASCLSYFDVFPDIVEQHFKSAFLLYTICGKTKKIIDAELELANFYIQNNKFFLAEDDLHLALKDTIKNNFYRVPEIYCLLSTASRYEGNFNKALKYAFKSVNSLKPDRDSDILIICYGELGLVYQELDQLESSIYWYKKCLEVRTGIPTDRFAYWTAYLTILQMIKANQTKQAFDLLRKLSSSYPPVHVDEKASLSQSLAHCYNAMHNYDKAEMYFFDMLKQYDKGDKNSEILMIANYDIGKFFATRQYYKKAKPYLEKAAALSKYTTASREMDLHFLLFKVDSAEGNFTAAIQHQQKSKALSDSIFTVTKNQQIEELLIQYQTEKKDQNIRLLEKESKLQHTALVYAHQTRNWLTGVAILFVIISGLLIYNSRLKQRTNKKLQEQRNEIEENNYALQHLVKEKEWLVREIHHRVKNNFQMVMGLLGSQSEYLETNEAIKAMTESQHRIQAMSLIHHKLYQSDNLSAINMAHYIHDLVDYLRDSFDIRQSVLFKLQIEPIELNLNYCIPMGLLLNEAITNAIKYAFPKNTKGEITILFKRVTGHELLLVIRDNGMGLPSSFDISRLGTLGLKLMKGLSEDIDGVLTINSNGGAEIMIRFIYDPERAN
ncbi:histidine kinase dimerization/phosphoacceptor domain -containing protein [Chitinophaga eiseniae]|uniref:histidine kinase n=1 Tax=Chitinophaga eiseniae TaxID=634771 RepID=A0A847SLF7_9BACT|nr:histidine kinase dimerization/phosphoacceptor domain -containing protein [Chitinophaga eiseniae]NLR78438.1 sensor histidine kinase [Chitinophaga eiseniae]